MTHFLNPQDFTDDELMTKIIEITKGAISIPINVTMIATCLLYTSDAADE